MSDQQIVEYTEADVAKVAAEAAQNAQDALMAKVQAFNAAGVSFVAGPGVLLFSSIGERPTVDEVKSKALEYGILAVESAPSNGIAGLGDILATGDTSPPPPPPPPSPNPYVVAHDAFMEACKDQLPDQARKAAFNTIIQAASEGDERVTWTPAKQRERHDAYFGIAR